MRRPASQPLAEPLPSPPQAERDLPKPRNDASQALPSPPQGERDRVRGFARAMRHEPSEAEQRLWRELRDRRLAGFKFRRQYVSGAYILDFYCPAARLAIELDGGQHGEMQQREHDEQRTGHLAQAGIRVLRFWNDVVLRQPQDVLERIEAALHGTPSPQPSPPRGGEGVSPGRRSHA